MAGFDLERYLNHSRKVDLSEFDFSEARSFPLTSDEIRCLEYMMDVESSTIVYLRALLGTCIIDDPDAVAFLSCWAYEEYFHGRTIREFLRSSGVEVRKDRYIQVKRNATIRERLEEIGSAIMCRLTPHFHAARCGRQRRRSRRIDAPISRLPGLGWFNLLTLSLDPGPVFD